MKVRCQATVNHRMVLHAGTIGIIGEQSNHLFFLQIKLIRLIPNGNNALAKVIEVNGDDGNDVNGP